MGGVDLRMWTRVLVTTVALARIAHADAPVDVAGELGAMGAKAKAPAIATTPPLLAGASCAPIAKADRAALKQRVLAWIDSQHPDEIQQHRLDNPDLLVVMNVGCKGPDGFIALDVSQDREAKNPGPEPHSFGTRRNYVLRLNADTIDVVGERTSSSSGTWMEWADEGRLSLLGQIDLDGDGALDILWSDDYHEGGSSRGDSKLRIRFATGATAAGADVGNLDDVRLVKGRTVIAGHERELRSRYGCVGKDARVLPCPEVAALQAAADRRWLADHYQTSPASEVPDRDQLLLDAATLGVKPSAALVAAVPVTTPEVRARRKVEQFLIRTGAVDPIEEVLSQPHPEARAFLDDLATKLGDSTCTATPLSTDDRAKVVAWIARQDQKPQDVSIAAAACGAYAWAAWSRRDDLMRREVLLDRDGNRILGFTYDTSNGPGVPLLAQSEKFFKHGDVLVGVVMGSGNLWVIADGKVVAQTKGDIGMYHYGVWAEDSVDVFSDGGTLWHATPTGRERLDLTLIKDHEARRAALARLRTDSPSSAPAYLAALRLFGADGPLIAECAKLPR